MLTKPKSSRPRRGAPDPADIRDIRRRSRRTQAQSAELLHVSERQFQRWESGEQEMPEAIWQRLVRHGGYRFPVDFKTFPDGYTKGWRPGDERRNTIENGDFVHLQPIVGPLIQARVWLDRVHDHLIDEDSYGGIVIGFPGEPEAGQEFGGFFVGERITFSRVNVMHVEFRPARTMPA